MTEQQGSCCPGCLCKSFHSTQTNIPEQTFLIQCGDQKGNNERKGQEDREGGRVEMECSGQTLRERPRKKRKDM